MEKRCKHCGYIPQKPVLTEKQFKSQFKIGDKATAWATDKVALITAIGEYRVLYTDFRGQERAASQRMRWRKLK
jgi:hypothetical protein